MKSWTPLWSMIVTSTLWSESKDVKILFVTLLALKDADGLVVATTAGLSRLSNLTFEECVEAIKVLESPDLRSDQNQEFEGRRIERIDGGWKILNHKKYRDMIQSIRRKEYQADWQADYRERMKAEKEVPQATTLTAPPNGKEWNPTPEQIRLAALFRRKPETKWSDKEIKAWKAIGTVSEQDIQSLERMYAAKLPEGKDYRRRDLSTLLNNFMGEVDRARNFKEPRCY